jgi:hypothetical protein
MLNSHSFPERSGSGSLLEFFHLRHVTAFLSNLRWNLTFAGSCVMSHARSLAVATILLLLPGCALFVADGAKDSGLVSAFPWSRQKTEAEDPNRPILKMVRLEASIITRPAYDP